MFKIKSINTLKAEFIGALEAEVAANDKTIHEANNRADKALEAYTTAMDKVEATIKEAQSRRSEAEALLDNLEA
ncbi:hypothetical protein LH51_16625 [Nitrincola sp. A-D6]|uniref:hypothetical protein n=1 Tax=Nitrincola sp. A-D6 TaxID=1545442 RepID=UPI00051FE50F|nr:hypothetical protein [Nitrincola sp. A-D6]KGK41221.1 hypothetical protein LH51_16625 [Nitrincola sp. A-D6]